MTLKEPLSHKATMHTLRNGALPVYSCHRRYYPNYHVRKSTSLRTYYGGVPRSIQVAQHFYIESPLLELFANGMVFGWLSSSNWGLDIQYCASSDRVSRPQQQDCVCFAATVIRPNPDGWNLDMRAEDVLNGFFLYSLLLEKAERRSILVLAHDESTQKGRLGPALAERNKAMEGIGQEAYPHACDLCFFVFEDGDGNLSANSIY
ncbi:hypothetical protein R3P38DRAFT_2790720 [Favolaschia claudopus]|uniref:CxC5 like cysteine cluster associated with KDZ domain-containing protein n=1 Tax=Favolaschia claudopus TaxID=2862362 RepID=A0AAW0AHJ5_9AGAR